MFSEAFVFRQRISTFATTLKSRQNHIASSSSTSRSFLIVLTTILLLFVSCDATIRSLLFSPDAREIQQTESSEEGKNEDTDLVKVSVVSEAVIPICKFQIAFYYSFIRSFSFVEIIATNEKFSIPISQSDFFRTLFTLIISPNAP